MSTLNCPMEHEEQAALIRWAKLNEKRYPDLAWLYAIPNGGHRHPAVAGKLKAEGVRRGYPDLGLDVARHPYHGLRIELKRRHGGRLSDEQRDWGDRLLDQGYAWFLCEGWEEAKDVLVRYLGHGHVGCYENDG